MNKKINYILLLVILVCFNSISLSAEEIENNNTIVEESIESDNSVEEYLQPIWNDKNYRK